MIQKFFKALLFFLGFLLILSICLVVSVDRSSFTEFISYKTMTNRLDSLDQNYKEASIGEALNVGFAKTSITPTDTVSLAGYGAREPITFNQILDSVFVRAIVFDNGLKRVSILSGDLLIIHPEVSASFYREIAQLGWDRNDVFLGATHSHSSIGGWAPGIAGKLFSGEFDQQSQDFVVEKMVKAIVQASESLNPGAITFVRNELGVHVKNRLNKGGDEDPWMRNILIQTEDGISAISAYSAHATCFSVKSRALTGDFPSYFHSKLSQDSLINFSMYMAGAVGSMGPDAAGLKGKEKAVRIGNILGDQVSLLARLAAVNNNQLAIDGFRLEVPMRPPQLKISENLAVRPWLFRAVMGDHQPEISILKLDKILLIGMPCDFSGELAVPLYEYASERGMNLIITSFNGGYMGYVTKDEWYNLPKYETRTMNWYGPDSGAYFSEIIMRIIDTIAE